MQIEPQTLSLRPELSIVPPPAPDQPPGTRRSFALELDDAPEALERVLAQLRRRRCRITDVAFAAPYLPGEAAHVVIGTETPPSSAHLVASWLGDIVSVVSVEPLTR